MVISILLSYGELLLHLFIFISEDMSVLSCLWECAFPYVLLGSLLVLPKSCNIATVVTLSLPHMKINALTRFSSYKLLDLGS